MTSLTFYGGVGEIGGNKILVESKEARIFLDFGESFTLLDDYFLPESFLSPRERFGLRDYFEFGLVPKLEGLYSKEAVEKAGLEYKEEPEFDAVFISHAHQDHWAHMRFLHPGIPIYMGECTKKILESTWVTTRQSRRHEGKEIRVFRSGKVVKVGDLAVRPIHVDHSVPGAYGFIVEAPEGAIVYTGDLRKHGPRADMTAEFIGEAKAAEPEALIIEGTRVSDGEDRKNYGEGEVYEGSRKELGKAGPAVVMRYPKDLDRFRTFYSIAKELGRKLVVSRKTAHLLKSLEGDPVGLPDPVKDGNIEIYGRELKTYGSWEKPLLEKCISPEEVRKNPSKYIFEADFWSLGELVDIKPEGGVLVHSMSEPFEEDPISVLGGGVLENWVSHFGLKHHQLHASGHASKKEVFEMVKEVGAKKVFPVHTTHPGLFRGKGVIRVEKGEKLEL